MIAAAPQMLCGPVPYKEITSTGPLTAVTLGNELGCQVAYQGDASLELFPSSTKPGDCGTLLVLDTALYAPAFSEHGSSAASAIGTSTAFTPVSRSDVSGAGTTADPYKVTTVADAGTTGVRLSQVDSYQTGQEAYRTDVTVQNTGAATATGVLYRAGDCYLQESDTGYGFSDPAAGAVGCSINANNSPAARIEQWYPITGGGQYMEAGFSEVWAHIGTHQPFPPSPTPTPTPTPAPTPAPTPVTPPRIFGPGGIVSAPSNRRCISRRNFRIRIKKRAGVSYVAAFVWVNKQRVATRRGSRITAPIDLRGLPKGRYTVKIRVITATGQVINGTRKYRTCAKKRKGSSRGPL